MPSEDKEIQSLKNDKKKAISRSNWKEVAEICNFLGNKLSERGRLEESLNEHQEELVICSQRLKDVKGVMLAHRCLGEVYAEMQEYNKSLKHLKVYLESAEKTKDAVEIQRSWATLGRTYFMKEDLSNAESAFIMALKLADRLVFNCHSYA
jgi:tetratricopeptide (TPR) repeat protein